MQRTLLVLGRSIVLLHFFAGLLIAQTSGPSISLSSPSKTAWETDQSSIALQGTAMVQGGVSNVVWVNHLGKRGVGTWTAAGEGKANWTIAGVPLRPGINLIAVTIVDAGNHSVTLNMAINRKLPAGTPPQQPLPVRSGTYNKQPIVYQEWNGMAVAEGDIILGPAGPAQSGKPTTGAPSKLAVQPAGLAISYTSQLWPLVGGVYQVPYITTGSSANLTTALSTFNSKFSGLIQFVSRTTEANYVNITVLAGGGGEGFSHVGVAGGEQTLTCGDACTVSTWLHEMGHTMGLYHEHQRPDRASYITLNLANADLPQVPGNYTLFQFDDQTIGLYDYASVMHYGPFGFSKAGLPVIESIPAGIPLSNETGYSTGDIDQIERLYNAAPSQVTVTTNPPGLQIVVDSVTYTAPQAFSWPLGSTHTLNVPADPQVSSPSDGSTYAWGNWNDLGARSHTITVRPGGGTLTTPVSKPAVTLYEANFVRLQPFAFMSPSVFPSGAATLNTNPAPTSEFGGSFYADRTLVTLTLTPAAGFNFYNWFNLPFPPADNPHSFFIQAPTTQAQAVYVTTPTTLVGESTTGPNTWNPGLSGTVDGNFAFLPTAFSPTYNGMAWNAGTSHTVAVDQEQSPQTTNVFYNWNRWSDGGAISHTILQPASGTQMVTASFTPFYAFYTVPAALGGANSSCYGGVTTTPVGTPYSANTVFDFYSDGTSVTASATANSDFPGMVFAGWSGSLSGTTNPDTITIHDQFVPTANFNTTTTPLTITSISPATAVSGSIALDVTINGTGFSSSTTFVYWNNSFRSSTFVSSTQLILHLNAGDLAKPGGQDIFVGNFITNASSNTCGVGAETSLLVTNTPPSPTVVSLTPNAGSGVSQTFSAVVSDPAGLADLKTMQLLLNTTSANQTSACSVYYSAGSNQLFLYDNAGTTLSVPVTPGSATTVSNSQCALAGTGSSVSKSGNNLNLKAALTFTSTFTGLKNIYIYASGNDGLNSGWVQKGTWTVPAPPSIVSLSPSSGTGVTKTFTMVYSDPNGLSDLKQTRVLFNTSVTSIAACFVSYSPGTNQLFLYNDAGTGTSAAVTPGSAMQVSNSQCTLSGTGSSFSKSGNSLTLKVALTFTGKFAGLKKVFLYAWGNSGLNSGWVQKGTWTVPTPPSIVSLTPNTGTGVTQTFTMVYSDPNGLSDLKQTRVLFNASVTSIAACFVSYSPGTNQLFLYNDAGTGTSAAVTPGSAVQVSNSQCTLSGTGSSFSKSGNNLTLRVALTFTGTFTGQKKVYLYAWGNTGLSSGWVQKGTWMP
jgi:hypothetical protein